MPIDPTGTKPQPTPKTPETPEINLACRRGGCDSMTATQIVIPTRPSSRLYRCVKCKFTWGINVGGFIDI